MDPNALKAKNLTHDPVRNERIMRQSVVPRGAAPLHVGRSVEPAFAAVQGLVTSGVHATNNARNQSEIPVQQEAVLPLTEDDGMTERFTDQLRSASQPVWSQAVDHRFVDELLAGTIHDEVMARYLVQDHRFLDSFLILLGAAIATSDSFEARLRFGQFIGMVSGEENTYFIRSFDALGVTQADRDAIPDTAPTAGFKAIMREAAATRSYAAALAVLNVAEWLYLEWALKAPQPLPANFVHAEWVTLHDNPEFQAFVAFLRQELDRVGPLEAEVSKDFFLRTVALEQAFFDAAYT